MYWGTVAKGDTLTTTGCEGFVAIDVEAKFVWPDTEDFDKSTTPSSSISVVWESVNEERMSGISEDIT